MLGGAAGALARAGLAETLHWPWATLPRQPRGDGAAGLARGEERGRGHLLGTGFCGALTTFSTFQIETIRLARDSGVAVAGAYCAGEHGGRHGDRLRRHEAGAMTVWIGVAVLGGLGAYARFVVGGRWGALVVNVTGSFVLGLLTGLTVTGDALSCSGRGSSAPTRVSTWMVESLRSPSALPISMAAGLAGAGLGWLIGGAF